jgi:hypothetical protein
MRHIKGALVIALGTILVPVAAKASDFKLGGTAQLYQDPDNSANDVIRIRTDIDPFFGTVSRRVNGKIPKLDNMLEFKAWFMPTKTCFNASPRLQISIDVDGDGTPDGNALGLYGQFGTFPDDPEGIPTQLDVCPPKNWMYEDFTGAGDILITGAPLTPSTDPNRPIPNEEFEWDLFEFIDQLPTDLLGNCLPLPPLPDGGTFPEGLVGLPWSQVEAFFNTVFPNHQVCAVALVDDARGEVGEVFAEFLRGTAFYDLISGGKNNWSDRNDTASTRGFVIGCNQPDHADDVHEGDADCDHGYDQDDSKFEEEQRKKRDRRRH